MINSTTLLSTTGPPELLSSYPETGSLGAVQIYLLTGGKLIGFSGKITLWGAMGFCEPEYHCLSLYITVTITPIVHAAFSPFSYCIDSLTNHRLADNLALKTGLRIKTMYRVKRSYSYRKRREGEKSGLV